MKLILPWVCAAFVACLTLPFVDGGQKDSKEKDILNYIAQQQAGKDVKKIVFIGDKRPHGGRGNHEFLAGAVFLAKTINANYDNAYAVVYPQDRMPKDLSHADAIVVLLNHGEIAVDNPEVQKAVERGAGFMAIHYGVEVNKGKQGDKYLDWIGGYFEPKWSVNPTWTPEFKEIPKHETTRGVKPFSVKDEWYYHMRFAKDMKGVTPILSALPPLKTIQGEGKKTSSHGGNPDVYEAVAAGKAQHVAWAYERPKGGRGFGFTGYHYYNNLENDSFRTLLLNAVAWTSGLSVPENGIPSKTPTKKDLDNWIEDGLRVGN